MTREKKCKKIGEGNHNLSIIVPIEKMEKFRQLAQKNNLSMGWLVNQAIDRMIETDSIHIYRDSIKSTGDYPKASGIDRSSIEELIAAYISKVKRDMEELITTSIDHVESDMERLDGELATIKKPLTIA